MGKRGLNKVGLGISVALLVVAAGCGDSDDSAYADPAVDDESGVVLQSYENGHPLTYSNNHPGVLEREAELIRLVNEYRISYGLDALIPNEELSDLARAHSKHMAESDFFNHENPEGDHPIDRADRAGFSYQGLGENIGTYQPTAEEVFQSWLDSPAHRKTLLDPAWTHVGTGYHYEAASDAEYFWTQIYLR